MRRAAAALLVLAACDGASSDPDPVVTPTPLDPAVAGAVRGVCRWTGPVPANPRLPISGSAECSALHAGPAFDEEVLVRDGRLQNVFVYVKEGLEKVVFAWPKEPLLVSNEKCVYLPRVAGAQVHQPIRFSNEDPTDHNVHGFSGQGDFNFMLRGRGTYSDVKLRRPEAMLRVKCDLHPWMKGFVFVLPHPFFKATGPDGAFEFAGLPPGDYVVAAWHEKFGEQTARVKVAEKGTVQADFEWSAK
jgi:plastocyanin